MGSQLLVASVEIARLQQKGYMRAVPADPRSVNWQAAMNGQVQRASTQRVTLWPWQQFSVLFVYLAIFLHPSVVSSASFDILEVCKAHSAALAKSTHHDIGDWAGTWIFEFGPG